MNLFDKEAIATFDDNDDVHNHVDDNDDDESGAEFVKV